MKEPNNKIPWHLRYLGLFLLHSCKVELDVWRSTNVIRNEGAHQQNPLCFELAPTGRKQKAQAEGLGCESKKHSGVTAKPYL